MLVEQNSLEIYHFKHCLCYLKSPSQQTFVLRKHTYCTFVYDVSPVVKAHEINNIDWLFDNAIILCLI